MNFSLPTGVQPVQFLTAEQQPQVIQLPPGSQFPFNAAPGGQQIIIIPAGNATAQQAATPLLQLPSPAGNSAFAPHTAGNIAAPKAIQVLPAVTADMPPPPPPYTPNPNGAAPRVEVGRNVTASGPAKPHLTIHGDVAFADGDDTNLIVNYVPAEFTDADLEALFAPIGGLRGARVIKDGQGGAKGFGFVRFTDLEGAIRALETMTGYAVRNKRLKVNIARPTGRVVMRQGRVVDLGAVPPTEDAGAASLELLREQQEWQRAMAVPAGTVAPPMMMQDGALRQPVTSSTEKTPTSKRGSKGSISRSRSGSSLDDGMLTPSSVASQRSPRAE